MIRVDCHAHLGVIEKIEIRGHSKSPALCASVSMLSLMLSKVIPSGDAQSGYSSFIVVDKLQQSMAQTAMRALDEVLDGMARAGMEPDLVVYRLNGAEVVA